MKKVRDMPRRQQQAVMSKIKPSIISRGSTKADIREIHHNSDSSDYAKNKYNIYRSEMIQHMDKQATKQYSKTKRREKRASKRAVRKAEREELEKQDDNQRGEEETSAPIYKD